MQDARLAACLGVAFQALPYGNGGGIDVAAVA